MSYHLKKLFQSTIASFLCTVCLSHGVRVSHKSMLNLANLLKCDIRRALLQLQFWCESGGGISQMFVDLTSTPLRTYKTERILDTNQMVASTPVTAKKTKTENCQTPKSNSDDDFMNLMPNKRPRSLIPDDASSTSSKSSSKTKTGKSKKRKTRGRKPKNKNTVSKVRETLNFYDIRN